MKILALDTFSGISGDMFLGLMVDLGIALSDIEAELRLLPIKGYALRCIREKRSGIEGTKVTVDVMKDQPSRNWADIDAMLSASPFADSVRDLSRRIFRRIGEAEAAVHGTPIEKVHFHEVGAVDSIVDVVGAAIALSLLSPDRVLCSPLPLSRGFVSTAHGLLPLPAPATLELLKGCPVSDGGCDKELVTPTGAAIAAEIATFDPLPPMILSKVGYGVGERVLQDRPNLLRGVLGESQSFSAETDRVTVLETHLDDSNPEWLGALMERLFAEGALDVAFSPLQMKKNRPGVRVTVVAPCDLSPLLSRTIMRETSAIGVRVTEAGRFKLHRELKTIGTPLGNAAIKLLYDGEDLVRVTPEFEDCRRIALEKGVPLPEVCRVVEQSAAHHFSPPQEGI